MSLNAHVIISVQCSKSLAVKPQPSGLVRVAPPVSGVCQRNHQALAHGLGIPPESFDGRVGALTGFEL